MGERVSKEKIQKEEGWLYYFGSDGYIWAAPTREKQKEGAVKKRVGNEKIVIEDGYSYYIDKEGYVCRIRKEMKDLGF